MLNLIPCLEIIPNYFSIPRNYAKDKRINEFYSTSFHTDRYIQTDSWLITSNYSNDIHTNPILTRSMKSFSDGCCFDILDTSVALFDLIFAAAGWHLYLLRKIQIFLDRFRRVHRLRCNTFVNNRKEDDIMQKHSWTSSCKMVGYLFSKDILWE